uniref:Uncharacterized protein n=1 Tax=Rhizophora mucronata TaxID=61149 RepID=A0A2P2QZL9_RHIMU
MIKPKVPHMSQKNNVSTLKVAETRNNNETEITGVRWTD